MEEDKEREKWASKMRESRWRSMSIMDLNLTRRMSNSSGSAATDAGGAGATPISSHTGCSGPGQSYELIKSTQVSWQLL